MQAAPSFRREKTLVDGIYRGARRKRASIIRSNLSWTKKEWHLSCDEMNCVFNAVGRAGKICLFRQPIKAGVAKRFLQKCNHFSQSRDIIVALTQIHESVGMMNDCGWDGQWGIFQLAEDTRMHAHVFMGIDGLIMRMTCIKIWNPAPIGNGPNRWRAPLDSLTKGLFMGPGKNNNIWRRIKVSRREIPLDLE